MSEGTILAIFKYLSDTLGPAGIVIFLLLGIIVYLLKQIQLKDNERKFWQEEAYKGERQKQERLYESLNTVAKIGDILENALRRDGQ